MKDKDGFLFFAVMFWVMAVFTALLLYVLMNGGSF